VIAARTTSVRRGGPQGQVDAGVFGVDDRQRPGGFFFLSKNFLHKKGIEQCESSKYSVPWRDMNAQADKTVFSEFGNIPDDHPRGRVSTCGIIDAGSVGLGDAPSSENNRF
jgi:hypothetical protein